MIPSSDDQLEAASAHALKIATRQWEASAVPGDVMYATEGNELHGIAAVVRERLTVAFANVDMRFCSHILQRPQQPVFTRSWMLTRAMCEICLPREGIRIPTSVRCDYCHELNYRPGLDKTRRLNVQMWQAGPITIYFGLCEGCSDTITAELAGGAMRTR